METTRRFLEQMGLPPGDLHELPSSTKRFPDGAQYRIEIPSTEGPVALAAIIEESKRFGVTIHRVSQGSGVMLMTDDEIREMASLARASNMEISLFARPIAAVRQAVDIPLDIYVEAPDDLGGFVRLYEIPEIVRIAAPVYIKFGLRNAPNIYPSGSHIENVAVALSRERVRRAKLGMDILQRYYPEAIGSELGAQGLALPVLA